MISVIVPVYNTEKYLRNCLDSILGQTYRELEILLIDDGSTDSSCGICDEYSSQDSRVQVWHHKNSGVSFSRNFGIEKCTGEWIIFADSDDWLDLTMLETMIDLARRTKADTICCGAYQGDESSVEERKIWRNFSDEEHVYDGKDTIGAVIEQSGTLWNKLLNGDVVRKLRFYEGIRYAEDTLFLAEYLLNASRVAVTKKCGYYYRYNREGNVVSAGINDRYLDYIEATRLLAEMLAQNGYQVVGIERAVDVLIRVLAQIPFNKKKDYAEYIVKVGNMCKSCDEYKKLLLGKRNILKQTLKCIIFSLAKHNFWGLALPLSKIIYKVAKR